jgi:16S rRNA (adenine1518-N6/adenine1519-N6)-dimethyltransferase
VPVINPSTTKDILHKHDIYLTKRLGQHFLIDGNILNKILEAAALTKDDVVAEVGPGIGTLTQPLAAAAGRVLAVEYDKRFPAILKETLGSPDNVEIIVSDAMDVDFESLGANKLVSNLPYNIGTPLLAKILEDAPAIKEMTVMLQKEVAARITAEPRTKDYGALTILVHCYADAITVTEVKRKSFLPPPAVDSTVIKLTRLDQPRYGAETQGFTWFVKRLFNNRRKALRGALKAAGYTAPHVSLAENDSDLDFGARAEALKPEQLYEIYRALSRSTS